MREDEEDISVVVPLYNHEKFIISALESVFTQTIQPREVIVVDDGSTDGSFDVVRRRFGNYSNLILWTKPNSGAHNTINAGIHRATSSNVAILNSDDIYEPERLRVCLALLERHNKAQVACTGISFIDGLGKKISNEWYNNALHYYQNCNDLALSLINGNFLMTTSNFVVRRSVFSKFGYFGNFRYAHDLAFLLRILAQGGEIAIDPRPLLKYRMHSSNTISEGVLKVKVEVAAVIAEHLTQRLRKDPSCFTPDYLSKLYSILDNHNIGRMLFPIIGMIASNNLFVIDRDFTNSDLSRNLLDIAK